MLDNLIGRLKDGEVAQGEPPGGVGEGVLASQLTLLKPFGLFCVGRLWVIGQCKVSQKNRVSEPEDEGGDGVLRQGHRGEGLLVVQLQDQLSLSSSMTAISLNDLILNMFLC